jgi:type IV pilus assembly protein PilA
MKTMQKGFTLIELMIVVAIIAILAAIAIPAYQNYLIRSQVTEGVTLMDGAKVAQQEFYANHGRFTAIPASAGLAPATSIVGKYVASVDITKSADAKAIILSTFNDTTANKAIQKTAVALTGIVPSGSEIVTWTCDPNGTDGTTVDQKFLPSGCR